jgi:hypothetical protein
MKKGEKAPPPRADTAPTPFSVGVETVDDHGDEIYNGYYKWRDLRAHNLADQEMRPGLDDASAFLAKNPPPAFLDFFRWARANRITLLAAFPAILQDPLYDRPEYVAYFRQITDFYQANGVPMVGTARDAMMPEDDIYDGILHLTHAGAIARTERLIPYLKPYLKTAATGR